MNWRAPLLIALLAGSVHAADPALIKEADAAWAAREHEGSGEQAIQLWQKALQSNPDSVDLYIKLTHACGRALRHTKSKAEQQQWADLAKDYGAKAVELAPNNPDALTMDGEALGQWARAHKGFHSLSAVRQAVNVLEKAVQIKPDQAFAHMLLAEMYTRAPGYPISVGDKKKGFEHAKIGAALKNAYAINHLILARLYVERGQKEEARIELNRLLEMPPSPDAIPETKADQEKGREMLKTL